MIRTICKARLAIALLAIAPFTANPDPAPFSLSLSRSTAPGAASKEVFLEVLLKNISDHPIQILRSSGPNQGEMDYSVLVKNSSGQILKTIKEQNIASNSSQDMTKPPIVTASSGILYTVQPGDSIRDSIKLGDIFKLAPDMYEITVLRELPTWLGTGTIRSNTIKVRVR